MGKRDIIADVSEMVKASVNGAADAVAELMERVRAGEPRALARAISLVEDGAGEAEEILRACGAYRGRALRVGITGPPGAGKSTLVDQMARQLRATGKTVGIVAVDPSSPYTGGALLGDRIRMQGFAGDSGVTIRSLASRGARGGLARAAAGVCSVLEASGRAVLLIETIGVGQDEIEVVGLADVTVLVLVPGMGDDVQSLKAGIMEAADVYVVNKADRGGAERVEAEIAAMQGLTAGARVAPVVRTVASTGEGVAELLGVIGSVAGEANGVPQGLKPPGGRRIYGTAEAVPLSKADFVQGLRDEGGDGALRLDHIGVAVRSIEAARGFYEALGMTVSAIETVEHEGVMTAMLALGESRIELLEPLVEESTIGRFLVKRGEGLHHIAIHADDIEMRYERLKGKGLRLVGDSIRTGAGGHRYFFVHPASTGGVLIEIVGDALRVSQAGDPRGDEPHRVEARSTDSEAKR